MRVSTAVAVLILAAGVAPSVALPYAPLFCCIRNVQVLPFADPGVFLRPWAHGLSNRLRRFLS